MRIAQPPPRKLSANLANLITFWSFAWHWPVLPFSDKNIRSQTAWIVASQISQLSLAAELGKTIKDEFFSLLHFFYRGRNAEVFSRSDWSRVARRSLQLWHLWASSLYWISKHRLTISDQREQNFDREKKMWIRIQMFSIISISALCAGSRRNL